MASLTLRGSPLWSSSKDKLTVKFITGDKEFSELYWQIVKTAAYPERDLGRYDPHLDLVRQMTLPAERTCRS